MARIRTGLAWIALLAAVAIPLGIAATSPLLEWRGPVYIAACFAGIAALGIVLVQPLLAGAYMPGLSLRPSRRLHAWLGAVLVGAVGLHVAGLWITSPPDMIDALLLRAPTWFSVLGVLSMWALVGAALLALLRRRPGMPLIWRPFHMAAALLAAGTGALHALLIQGTMGYVSKAILCALVLAAAARVAMDRRLGLRRLLARG